MPAFQLESPFQPAGDQPQAIEKLVQGRIPVMALQDALDLKR